MESLEPFRSTCVGCCRAAGVVQANVPPPPPSYLASPPSPDADGLRITRSIRVHMPNMPNSRSAISSSASKAIGSRHEPGEQQHAVTASHMWQLDLIVVHNRRDIVEIRVHA